MSQILMYLMLWGVGFPNLNGQTKDHTQHQFTNENIYASDLSDFRYYFFLDRIAYDVRTMKPIQTEIFPGYTVLFQDAKILGVADGRRIGYFGADGKKIGEIPISSALMKPSPGLDYVLEVKDGDLWRRDIINFKSLGNAVKLTELGVFGEIKFVAWLGDKYYPDIRGQVKPYYKLDVRTKVIEEYNGPLPNFTGGKSGWANTYDFVGNGKSPYSNWFLYTYHFSGNTTDFYTYNFQTGTEEKYPSLLGTFEMLPITTVWLSPDTAFVFVNDPAQKYQSTYIYGGKIITFDKTGRMKDVKTIQWKFRDIDLNELETHSFYGVNFLDVLDSRSRCASPGGRYILVPTHESGNWTTRASVELIDLEDESIRPIFKSDDDNNIRNTNSMLNSVQSRASFLWTSSTAFIYTTFGDLLAQGTWVYDVTTNKTQKVSNLIAEKFLLLGNREYVVFQANGKLFRAKPDGTEVREISTITQIGNNSDLVPLLK